MFLSRGKPADRQGQVIAINASAHFVKRKPKNVLTNEGITSVIEVFRAWENRDKLSRVLSVDEVRATDYNVSPSQFISVGDVIGQRPLAAILEDLQDAHIEREGADAALDTLMRSLRLIR